MGMRNRIATLALAGAAVVCCSGCHEFLKVTLGGPDPPVHRKHAPSAGRVYAEHSAAGRAFTGRAEARLTGRITLRHGFVKSTIKNGPFVGHFAATLTGPAQPGDDQLGPLAAAQWHALFSTVRNRKTGKITMTGLLLATFDDASQGRACMRISYSAKRKQNKKSLSKSRSTVTMLGGEGGARTLAGTASVGVTVLPSTNISMRGTLRSSRTAARGLTPACKALEHRFGLRPL